MVQDITDNGDVDENIANQGNADETDQGDGNRTLANEETEKESKSTIDKKSDQKKGELDDEEVADDVWKGIGLWGGEGMKSVKGQEWGSYEYVDQRGKKGKKSKKGKKVEKGGEAGGTGANQTDVWIWKGIGIWGGNSKLEKGAEWKLDDDDDKNEKKKKAKKGKKGGKSGGRYGREWNRLRSRHRGRGDGNLEKKLFTNSIKFYII